MYMSSESGAYFVFGIISSVMVITLFRAIKFALLDSLEDPEFLARVRENPQFFERCCKCSHWVELFDTKKKVACTWCGHLH